MIVQSKRINPILAVLVLVAFVWLSVVILKGIYSLLSIVAIPLVIITAVIDHNIIIDYFKGIISDLKQNPGLGIVKILFTTFGFPFLAGWLFLKALARRKLIKMQGGVIRENPNEYVDFEEVKDYSKNEDVEVETFTEFPKQKEKLLRPDQEPPEDINHYEKLFESNK